MPELVKQTVPVPTRWKTTKTAIKYRWNIAPLNDYLQKYCKIVKFARTHAGFPGVGACNTANAFSGFVIHSYASCQATNRLYHNNKGCVSVVFHGLYHIIKPAKPAFIICGLESSFSLSPYIG